MKRQFKVLFVGQNPAVSRPTSAFVGTKSVQVLEKWIRSMGLSSDSDAISFTNTYPLPTDKNARPDINDVNPAELRDRILNGGHDLVIALGTFATEALTLAGIPHHAMPHPSGRNRKLNSPEYVEQMLTVASEVVQQARRRFHPLRRVVLESPFAGDIAENVAYAKRCVHDCLLRGEAPIASHLLFTQPGILDDNKPEERKLGIAAGHAWTGVADAVVVYADRGISKGMEAGLEAARAAGVAVEVRTLPGYELEQQQRAEQQ